MQGFDVIGDVHGCLPELLALLRRLGYGTDEELNLTLPLGRQLILVGDLVDRGPDTPGVLKLVMKAVAAGQALAVRGNHDERLGHALSGGHVRKPTANLESSLKQLVTASPTFRRRAAAFLLDSPPQLTLDEGRLLVAHAGDRADLAGSERGEYNVHGHDFEERDAYGHPVREDWAALHTGPHLIVSGHTPVRRPQQRGQVAAGESWNIDTGCVYGGSLTALRYPERQLVSVRAARAYMPSRLFEEVSGVR
ncbi:metallophosphoesterase [Deinococcus psychrotolerans]|uniref:metallophosphoesterase n=1 Tax=Deinococcus psychrotolerans TaxID=2489213 RepID=UPI001F152DD5|nr:metallophosphoesterase [Deinococcus psychrotolerans]